MIDKLHYVDDKVFGYKYGYIFWLTLYSVSLGVLSGDSTTGPQREYLTNTSLMCCFTLLVYFYHHFVGNPASLPGMHGAGTEAFARLIYAAHCGWGNLVGTNPIGVWNGVCLGLAVIFGASKLIQSYHTTLNRELYLEYVQRKKDEGIF